MQIDLGTLKSITFKMDKEQPRLEVISTQGVVELAFNHPTELDSFITRMTVFQRLWEDQRDAS